MLTFLMNVSWFWHLGTLIIGIFDKEIFKGESYLHARADVLKLVNSKFYSKNPKFLMNLLVCVIKNKGKS